MLTADKGTLALTEFGHDAEMVDRAPKVDLGAEFTAMYGHSDSVNTWPNSNMSPHFPFAARIWSAAWLDKSGERVDGVLSVDPGALARLLAASGPTRTGDGTVVAADNVVDLSERINYMTYPDPLERKAFLLNVARAAAGQSADRSRRSPAAARAAPRPARGAGQGADEGLERPPRRAAGAGVTPGRRSLPPSPAPYAGLVVNNAAGTKLDYYLDRTLDCIRPLHRHRPRGHRQGVLANRAPSQGFPPTSPPVWTSPRMQRTGVTIASSSPTTRPPGRN